VKYDLHSGLYFSGFGCWFRLGSRHGLLHTRPRENLATIPVQELREVALPAVVDIADGSGDTWEQLTLKHKSGQEIAVIERKPVVKGELGADELQEFLDEVPQHKPDSAAAWLPKILADREDHLCFSFAAPMLMMTSAVNWVGRESV
jgi:hypothetical protein